MRIGKRDISLRSIIGAPPLWLGVLLLAPFAPRLLFPNGLVIGNPYCDNPSMFYYINAFAGQCWRQGFVPLWNPHIMLGLPFLGEGQAALFHPLSWLFILLPTGAAINWLIALSVLLSGLFFYGYLRALELSRGAAFLGAAAWAFSTIHSGRFYAGHLTILLELIEIPLIMMLWEHYRRTRVTRHLAWLAAAYGAMILAAYPQLLYTFSLFFMLYVLIQSAPALATRAGAREEGRAIALLGAFVLLGVGIGAVQLLPAADFAAQSGRAKPSLEFCWAFALPPENLASLVVPRLCGYTPQAGAANYWGRHNYWEACLYIGMLPLLLAGPGLLATPPRRRRAMLACLVIFTAISVGKATPLFELLYRYLPGFSYFRGPSKYMLPVQFCLMTFGAYGIESLLHPPEGKAARRRQLLAALAMATLALAVAGILFVLFQWIFKHTAAGGRADLIRANIGWIHRELAWALAFIGLGTGVVLAGWRAPRRFVEPINRFKLFPRCNRGLNRDIHDSTHGFVGQTADAVPQHEPGADRNVKEAFGVIGKRWLMPLMLVIILADSLRIFLPMLHTYNEKDLTRCEDVFLKHIAQTPYPARVLAPVLFSNMPMLHGYASASGYSGNTLGRFNTFVNTVTQSPPDRLQALNPIKGYTEAPVFRFLAYDFAILEKEELPQNYEVLEAADPFYLIPYPKPFPRAYLAAAPVAAGSEADALAYVCAGTNNLHQSPVAEQADLGGVAAAPPGADEDVRFIDFKPNRVELEARAARRRVLVLGEAYEKNWTATINGQRAAVFPVNYLFRGVVVPEGTSRVVFDYRPASFRWGATVSGVSLILLVGLLRMGVRRKRGTRSAEHGKFRNVECGMGNEEAIDKNALHKEPQRTRKGPQRGNTRRGIR